MSDSDWNECQQEFTRLESAVDRLSCERDAFKAQYNALLAISVQHKMEANALRERVRVYEKALKEISEKHFPCEDEPWCIAQIAKQALSPSEGVMDKFTDDNLKELRKSNKEGPTVNIGPNMLQALLRRLECAEKVIMASVFPKSLDRAGQINLESWLRSCGKEGRE